MSHTTLPVRRVVISKFETAFADIPEVKTVRMFKPIPDDVAANELPALYLFEIQPEDRSFSNRIAIGTMHFLAQVFIGTTIHDSMHSAFDDLMNTTDVIQARLHAIFHSSVGLSKNGLVNVTELQYDRIITNDSVGVLTATFDVEYRHDRGNAFS
jgi:hypothetical protein